MLHLLTFFCHYDWMASVLEIKYSLSKLLNNFCFRIMINHNNSRKALTEFGCFKNGFGLFDFQKPDGLIQSSTYAIVFVKVYTFRS